MKKKIYLILTVISLFLFLSACSFLSKTESNPTDPDVKTSTDATEDPGTNVVPEDAEDVPVSSPSDSSDGSASEDETGTDTGISDNPQDNVASDSSREFTATGTYYGFVDSHSVQIGFSDGSFYTFFAFDDTVVSLLSNLDEEEMPTITFLYQGRDGQINPEIIKITQAPSM